MAGVRGRSGGRRRGAGRPSQRPAAHELANTWRPDRHGSRVVGATARAVLPARAPRARLARAPAHLRPETRRWYASVVAGWTLDQHHVLLLQAAAESWDQAQTARERLAIDGLTVPTKDGGCKAHPCLSAARTARAQFATLMTQLDLDDAGTPAGGRDG